MWSALFKPFPNTGLAAKNPGGEGTDKTCSICGFTGHNQKKCPRLATLMTGKDKNWRVEDQSAEFLQLHALGYCKVSSQLTGASLKSILDTCKSGKLVWSMIFNESHHEESTFTKVKVP